MVTKLETQRRSPGIRKLHADAAPEGGYLPATGKKSGKTEAGVARIFWWPKKQLRLIVGSERRWPKYLLFYIKASRNPRERKLKTALRRTPARAGAAEEPISTPAQWRRPVRPHSSPIARRDFGSYQFHPPSPPAPSGGRGDPAHELYRGLRGGDVFFRAIPSSDRFLRWYRGLTYVRHGSLPQNKKQVRRPSAGQAARSCAGRSPLTLASTETGPTAFCTSLLWCAGACDRI